MRVAMAGVAPVAQAGRHGGAEYLGGTRSGRCVAQPTTALRKAWLLRAADKTATSRQFRRPRDYGYGRGAARLCDAFPHSCADARWSYASVEPGHSASNDAQARDRRAARQPASTVFTAAAERRGGGARPHPLAHPLRCTHIPRQRSGADHGTGAAAAIFDGRYTNHKSDTPRGRAARVSSAAPRWFHAHRGDGPLVCCVQRLPPSGRDALGAHGRRCRAARRRTWRGGADAGAPARRRGRAATPSARAALGTALQQRRITKQQRLRERPRGPAPPIGLGVPPRGSVSRRCPAAATARGRRLRAAARRGDERSAVAPRRPDPDPPRERRPPPPATPPRPPRAVPRRRRRRRAAASKAADTAGSAAARVEPRRRARAVRTPLARQPRGRLEALSDTRASALDANRCWGR